MDTTLAHVYVYRDCHRRTHNTLHTCLAAHTHDQHCTHPSTHTYSPTQIVLLHPSIVYYSTGTAPATSTATHHHAAHPARVHHAPTPAVRFLSPTSRSSAVRTQIAQAKYPTPHLRRLILTYCVLTYCVPLHAAAAICACSFDCKCSARELSNRWWELSCKRATKENWSNSIFLVPTTGSRQHIHGRTDMCIPVWSRLLGAEVCLWPVLRRGRTLEQRLALVKLADQVPAWATKKKS